MKSSIKNRKRYKDRDFMRKELVEKDKEYKALAREIGVSDSTVRMWAARLNIQKPLENRDYLEGLHDAGLSSREIAEKIEREPHQVILALHEYGIKMVE